MELLYACCAMWVLGLLTFVGTHEPPKELVGINILTYHITTYVSHMAVQGEALVPYQIVIAVCLVLAGGAVLKLRNTIKKLDL